MGPDDFMGRTPTYGAIQANIEETANNPTRDSNSAHKEDTEVVSPHPEI